ncbi:hypothetical protein M1432_03100 [Patescibacteria group bacterium]|nr:hypothetical protein [Patescibacteria group bacterium]
MRGLLVSALALGAFLLIVYFVFGGLFTHFSPRPGNADLMGIVVRPR